ncbi:hypothetical protein JOH51_001677 [Rhizobium leguminosarum]|nr:hypothetical protein [Rhizobium leguminosarum]
MRGSLRQRTRPYVRQTDLTFADATTAASGNPSDIKL